MRTVIAVLVVLLLTGWKSPAPAQDRKPAPYVAASESGSCYFKLVPDAEREGVGRAYRVTAEREDTLLWSVSGWYSRGTFLSEDGRYLVRMESALKAGHVLFFYDSGELLARHTAAELLTDSEKTAPRGAHSSWYESDASTGIRSDFTFRVTTVERIEHVFDVRTGAIVEKRER